MYTERMVRTIIYDVDGDNAGMDECMLYSQPMTVFLFHIPLFLYPGLTVYSTRQHRTLEESRRYLECCIQQYP